jgi:hypothetical protein
VQSRGANRDALLVRKRLVRARDRELLGKTASVCCGRRGRKRNSGLAHLHYWFKPTAALAECTAAIAPERQEDFRASRVAGVWIPIVTVLSDLIATLCGNLR